MSQAPIAHGMKFKLHGVAGREALTMEPLCLQPLLVLPITSLSGPQMLSLPHSYPVHLLPQGPLWGLVCGLPKDTESTLRARHTFILQACLWVVPSQSFC